MTERADISSVLAQMRLVKAQIQAAHGDGAPVGTPINDRTTASPRSGFGQMLTSAIDEVNSLQKQSAALQHAFETGEEGVSLAETMIASQKAAVAFQAVTQVRNKVITAYESVMNMPI